MRANILHHIIPNAISPIIVEIALALACSRRCPTWTRTWSGCPHRGLPLDPSQEREGCDFYERCPHKCEKCLTYDREMVEIGPGHFSRCWRTEE